MSNFEIKLIESSDRCSYCALIIWVMQAGISMIVVFLDGMRAAVDGFLSDRNNSKPPSQIHVEASHWRSVRTCPHSITSCDNNADVLIAAAGAPVSLLMPDTQRMAKVRTLLDRMKVVTSWFSRNLSPMRESSFRDGESGFRENDQIFFMPTALDGRSIDLHPSSE